MYLLKLSYTPKNTNTEVLIDKIGPLTKEQFDILRDEIVARFVEMGWERHTNAMMFMVGDPMPVTLVDRFNVSPTIRIHVIKNDSAPFTAFDLIDKLQAALHVGPYDVSGTYRGRR